MKHAGIKIVIILNYIIFAMLLNSVGILIQKSMNVYGVSAVTASTLELFKDMSIAVASFLLGS
ncbi:MAG: MFS transporter, partial [Saprospiraceae bacterium]|nr:MFS transporter [Saprospiraceae bacterium]